MNSLTQLLRITPLALALAPAAVWADTSSEIADLKARLQQLEQQVKEAAAKPAPAAAPAAAPSNVAGIQVGDTSVKFSGYFKADAIATKFSDGAGPTTAGSGAGRLYFNPNSIPVYGISGNPASVNNKPSNYFDMTAKQTRFALATSTPTSGGTPIKGYLEMDFYGVNSGNTNVTNAYNPELRHAYLSYGNWLAGQTWSTFQNADVFPETADYVGASNGTIFVRQAQLRYTNGGFAVAAENAQTVVGTTTSATASGKDSNSLPDLVAKYTHKGDFGHVSLALIGRQLKSSSNAAINSKTNVAGISLSGKLMVGKTGDDIRFMLTSGRGLGRYVALNTANDAVLDAANHLHVINETAGYVTYRHLWNDKWRSNFQYSAFEARNPSVASGDATKSSRAYLANIFYGVTPKLDVGVELMHANRTVQGGATTVGGVVYAAGQGGDMNRVQGTVKYTF